jgi:CRISPR/Cas system-associated exonuclease Cas4 (RecB family)
MCIRDRNNSIEVSIFKSDKEIEKLKEEIQNVVNGILNNNFEARPIYQACSFCPYKDICPSSQK